MLNHRAPLNEIAEDHNEWGTDSCPLENPNSYKLQLQPIAMHGLKFHPSEISDVYNQDVRSNLKFTGKSMTDGMLN
jgi:hypothetical protein